MDPQRRPDVLPDPFERPMSEPPVVIVEDPDDPRLDPFRRLADRGRERIIAEGPNVVRRMLASPYRVRTLLVTARRADELAPDLAARPVRQPAPSSVGPAEEVETPTVLVADGEVIDEVVGFRLHQGVVAEGPRCVESTVAHVIEEARTLAVVEALHDPANLGLVYRSAAALGLDGVLLGPRCSDPLYRRTVRTSMGWVLHLPWARLDALPGSLDRLDGFTLVALTPDETAQPLRDLDLGRDERVALLLGAEGPGLTAETLGRADHRVRIPMARGVDSLNVAVAAGIAFHAVSRAPYPASDVAR